MSKVFYVPGSRWCLDSVNEVNGQEIGKWSGKTLAEIQTEEPGAICIESEEATKRITELAIKPAVEVDRDRFEHMLEILPPCAWVRESRSESFHMSEFDVCDVTGIFVRIGTRYFQLHDNYRLTHAERLGKVREVFKDV